MVLREKILSILEERAGGCCPGAELGRELGVSRTAVWKNILSLRADGYPIESHQSRGYSLAADSDVLSEFGIAKYLRESGLNWRVRVAGVTDSTNEDARALAERGGEDGREGVVVAARAQRRGRGRYGRSFFSPDDLGIYLSVILRPTGDLQTLATHLTTQAAVAACEAIAETTGREAQIKWVNDVFIDGKKVAGILTEGVASLESGGLEYAVSGIGFNAYAPEGGYPPEAGQAGAVFAERVHDGKNRLAAAFLNSFALLYLAGDTGAYLEEYRRRSAAIGRRVRITSPRGEKTALAVGVDDDCRLLVEYPDGSREALSSGEVGILL